VIFSIFSNFQHSKYLKIFIGNKSHGESWKSTNKEIY
jgi:hypothetical protein